MTAILRETTFHICVSMEVQEQSTAGLMRKDSNDGKCKDFNSKAPIYYDVVDCADKYRKVSFPVLAVFNYFRNKNYCLLVLFSSPRDRVQRLK